MQRIKEIRPGFDKRSPNPKENFGIHCAEILMLLKGAEGCVQFLIFTGRNLPHVQLEFCNMLRLNHPDILEKDFKTIEDYSGDFSDNPLQDVLDWLKFLNRLELDFLLSKPMGADLGYHSPKPIYDGQQPMRVMLKRFEFDGENVIPAVYGDPVICPYLDNDVPCYYDGSGLSGQRVFDIFVKGGEEAVWLELERYYNSVFEKV